MNLLGGTIYGFPAIFKVLSKNKIYQNLCSSSTTDKCSEQLQQYQNGLTLGIAFFDLPSFVIGILIDKFGCRFVKLISIIFHIIGWLSLALLKPGRDYLLYIHCIFSSISGIVVVITTYTSSNYFSKSRAFVASLLAGAGISSTMWFSIFQAIIDNEILELSHLAYIWLAFGLLMLITSFLFLDWKYSFLNLPYKFDVQLESTDENELNRNSFWKHFRSPLYILVVLFLSILLIPSVFLAVVWEPSITFITEHDKSLANKYTFAYNVTMAFSIIICPINGFLLGFKADKSKKQKLLNISLVQTTSWLLNIALCIIPMFLSPNIIIPILIINCLSRATIVAACQAVISTFFPSTYIGRLTGIMWTIVGIITFIQFALVKLTNPIEEAWRAWLIILLLVVIMSCHLIQIWIKYFKQKKIELNNFILSGGAFLSFGILVLYKHDLHDLFAILSYDSHIVPSIHIIAYVLIGIGIFVFIIGLLGCCGSVRESRLLLGLYVFFIILVMGGELVVAMYTVLLSKEWDTRLPNTLKQRLLKYNYSIPQQFEHDLDIIHKKFSCCGIDGPSDFYNNVNYKIYDRHLPLSCCTSLLNGICLEVDAYRFGCYQTINEYVHLYSRLIVAVGIGIALYELTALILAVCVCRYTIDEDDFD
ncbi:unnamed protein product [Rotaria sp. Silwood1]|nr:unnamed protein product [Rotaria sp. Silwood1]